MYATGLKNMKKTRIWVVLYDLKIFIKHKHAVTTRAAHEQKRFDTNPTSISRTTWGQKSEQLFH